MSCLSLKLIGAKEGMVSSASLKTHAKGGSHPNKREPFSGS